MSRSSSSEKDLEVVLDNNLVMNQQCATEMGRTNSILGCLNGKNHSPIMVSLTVFFIGQTATECYILEGRSQGPVLARGI